MEWKKLIDSPARGIKRLKVDNARTRILTLDEQRRLMEAAPRKMRALIALALITGARVGELLRAPLGTRHRRRPDVHGGEERQGPADTPVPSNRAVLGALPRQHAHVFTKAETMDRYTTNGARHVFARAVDRAGIRTAT